MRINIKHVLLSLCTWKHFLCVTIGIIIGMGIFYLYSRTYATKSIVCEHIYQGIDVSHHQGHIDWYLVSNDKRIRFVYVKATEGATYIDSLYSYNVTEARRNGLKIGSYHYLRNTSSIFDQFRNFSATADRNLQDLIPMVDVEEKVEKDSILKFCKLVERHYGKRPAIYGTNRSYNSFCAPDFNDYILMIGRYGQNEPIIKGRGHYSIWQYSEKGQIIGVGKPVDLDRLHPDFQIRELNLR